MPPKDFAKLCHGCRLSAVTATLVYGDIYLREEGTRSKDFAMLQRSAGLANAYGSPFKMEIIRQLIGLKEW